MVESYDVISNTWSQIPSMVNRKYDHRLVAVKDKLFVIGFEKYECEVFEKICKKFVYVKTARLLTEFTSILKG